MHSILAKVLSIYWLFYPDQNFQPSLLSIYWIFVLIIIFRHDKNILIILVFVHIKPELQGHLIEICESIFTPCIACYPMLFSLFAVPVSIKRKCKRKIKSCQLWIMICYYRYCLLFPSYSEFVSYLLYI